LEIETGISRYRLSAQAFLVSAFCGYGSTSRLSAQGVASRLAAFFTLHIGGGNRFPRPRGKSIEN